MWGFGLDKIKSIVEKSKEGISRFNEETVSTLSSLNQQTTEKIQSLSGKLDEELKPLSEKIDRNISKPFKENIEKPFKENVEKPVKEQFEEPFKENLQQTSQKVKSTSKSFFGIDLDLSQKKFSSAFQNLNFFGNDQKKYVSQPIKLLPEFFKSNSIDLNAGSDFLKLYEKNNTTLYQNNKLISIKAQEVDKKINPVLDIAKKNVDTFDKLWEFLGNSIGNMVETLDSTKTELLFLGKKISKLEEILTLQTEEVMKKELENWKNIQNNQFKFFKKKKEQDLVLFKHECQTQQIQQTEKHLELEKMKIQMVMQQRKIEAEEKERLDRIKEKELILERERKELQERKQLALQFKQDLKKYQTTGSVGKKKKKKTVSKISKIEIENSEKDLKEFLGNEEDDENAPLLLNPEVENDENENPTEIVGVVDYDPSDDTLLKIKNPKKKEEEQKESKQKKVEPKKTETKKVETKLTIPTPKKVETKSTTPAPKKVETKSTTPRKYEPKLTTTTKKPEPKKLETKKVEIKSTTPTFKKVETKKEEVKKEKIKKEIKKEQQFPSESVPEEDLKEKNQKEENILKNEKQNSQEFLTTPIQEEEVKEKHHEEAEVDDSWL